MKWSLRKALDEGIARLKAVGVEEAELDARILLQETLQLQTAGFLLRQNEIMEEEAKEQFFQWIEERALRKPLQYIIGEQEFMGTPIKVNSSTLIPRRETEELVEWILAELDREMRYTALDIGTGTGCIPIALCKGNGNVHFLAVDYSEEALGMARRNVIHHELENRIELRLSNIYEAIDKNEGFDIIISNPPYIETDEIELLTDEVKTFEPRMALDGGPDGLEYYRRIIQEAPLFLREEGTLFLEIGYNQKNGVFDILTKSGFTRMECKKDLSGNDRMIKARL